MAKSYRSIKPGWKNENASTRNSETGSAKKKSYRDIKAADYDFGVSNNDLKSFSSRYNDYLNNAHKDSGTLNYANRADISRRYSSQGAQLKKEAENLYAYMGAHKQSYGTDAYEDYRKFLSSVGGDIDAISKYFSDNDDYMSQFDSEEAYKGAVREGKYRSKYEGMSYGDISKALDTLSKQSGRAHIGGYDNAKELDDEIEWLNNYKRSDRAVIDSMTSEEIDNLISDNESRISELKEERERLITEQKRATMMGRSANVNSSESYKSNNKRIAEIDEEIKSLGSGAVMYHNEDGSAVTLERLRWAKNIEDNIGNITTNPQLKSAYEALSTYKEDIGRAEGAMEALKDGDTSDVHRSDLEYIIEKYGINTDGNTDESISYDIYSNVYLPLISGNYAGQTDNKTLLENSGYSWDDIEEYHDFYAAKERAAELDKSYDYFAQSYPGLATASAIAAAPGQLVDYAGNIIDAARGKMPNAYDDGFTNFIQQSNESVTKKIDDSIDNEVLSWLATGAYSGATSSLQSAITGAACTAIFGPAAGAKVALGVMGSEAAASAFNSAVKNGSTNGQALIYSVSSGVFEAIFEKLPLDHIIKVSDAGLDVHTLSSYLKSVAKSSKNAIAQGLIEGGEEFGTEVFNKIADGIINRDHSEYENAILRYKEAGYSEEDAKRLAGTDLINDILQATYGGFVGGAGTGTVQNVSMASKYAPSAILNNMENNAELATQGSIIINEGNISSDIESAKASGDGRIRRQAKAIERVYNRKIDDINTENGENSAKKQVKSSDFSVKELRNIGRLYDEISDREIKKKLNNGKEQFRTEIRRELKKLNVADIKDAERVIFKKMYVGSLRPSEERFFREIGGKNITDKIIKAIGDPREETTADKTDGKTIDVKVSSAAGSKLADVILDNGNIYAVAENGETVAPEEFLASSSDDAAVLSRLSAINDEYGLDTEGVHAIFGEWTNYTGELSAEEFMRGAEIAYRNGLINRTGSKNPAFAKLGNVADNVFKIGREAAERRVGVQQSAIDEATLPKKKKAGNKTGKIIAEDGIDINNATGEIDETSLSGIQKANLTGIKALAKLSPINFHIFRSEKIDGEFVAVINGEVVENSPNGVYFSGTNDIWIDINAGDFGEGTMLWTASHEISHYIRERAPKRWKAIADFLIEEYSKRDDVSVYDLLKDKKAKILSREDSSTKTGAEINDEAYEELVSDALSDMLTDGSVIETLAELKQKDKSLWQTIKDAVADLLRRWGEVLGVYEGRRLETAEARALNGMQEAFKKLQKMYAEAFAEANEMEAVKTEKPKAMHSERTFSYDELVAKDDLSGKTIKKEQQVPLTKDGSINLAEILETVKSKCSAIQTNRKSPTYYVDVSDIDTNVEITRDGIKHGFFRGVNNPNGITDSALVNARIALELPDILKGAIEVNRSNRDNNPSVAFSSVLIGVARIQHDNSETDYDYYAVRFVVLNKTDGSKILKEANIFGTLKSANAKKIGQHNAREVSDVTSRTQSDLFTYSVADLLNDVKNKFVGTFSEDVYQHLGTQRKIEKGLTEHLLYSERNIDSNRSLLANALESVAQTEEETRQLKSYKAKIAEIEELQKRLSEINAEIKELSFSKGKRDTERLRTLRDEAIKTANRINIYDRKLLNLEATEALKKLLERERAAARKKQKAKSDAVMKAASDRRKKSAVKVKIKNFKARLEKSLLNPTDNVYVPGTLINSIVEVCELIDTDTYLYNKDGSINLAQEKRNLTKERLQALKDDYEAFRGLEDPAYSGEFDEGIYAYLTELNKNYAGRSLSEMTLEELSEMYDMLKAIEGTLRDARKLIGKADAKTIQEAADDIVAEQEQVAKKRKKTPAQKLKDNTINLSLSPIRNVERMTGYNENSIFFKLFQELEKGVRKKNLFVMKAYKDFEALTTGENSKTYEDAIYKEYGNKKYVDTKGKSFGISKMQMMQAILSHEREAANNMNHIKGGGLVFADMDMLRKGKLRDAVSAEYYHSIENNAVTLIEEFKRELANDTWAQEYMQTARQFFNGTAKDAINRVFLALKHRILAKDSNYIPFEVDTNFIVRDISEDQKEDELQRSISSYGMLKQTKDGASQPIFITGLNNILDRHIEQVGNIEGLAIPVRDFNKVWNARCIDSTGRNTTTKEIVQSNWGLSGTNHIIQAIKDIQSPRPDKQNMFYKKLKSGYIGATFTLNLSVVTKQIGSLYSATSMLGWRDPTVMMANLISTMANHKEIAAEVDRYTASAWMRRQGLSDAELHTLITESQKVGLAKFFSKMPTVINPTKWITAMDHMVALSLWKYAKEDVAKRTGLSGEELLKATAEYYDSVIENTQSMTDVLHRPEIQKRNDVISESLGMFKTDLYQMAGQLEVSIGRYNANKNKANAKALGKTVYAVLASAIWGQLMTCLFAMLRYKVDPYRDEEEDLTVWSWLKRVLFEFGGDLVGYFVPLFGSEAISIVENFGYGESSDIANSLSISASNDLLNAVLDVAGDVKNGEIPSAKHTKKLATKALQIFGIPANNIFRTMEAIQLHAKDIANGEFLSFEAGADRTDAERIYRYHLAEKKELVDSYINYMLQDKMKRLDKDEDEAKSLVKSQLTKYLKPIYIEAFETDDKDTMISIRKLMAQTGVYGSVNKTVATSRDWENSHKKDVRESAYEAKDAARMDLYNAWVFKGKAKADTDSEGNTITGSKKQKVLEYIDSLDLKKKEKDEIYLALGYSESELKNTPWH